MAYAFLGAAGTVPPLSTLLNERLQSVDSAAQYAPEAPLVRRRPDGIEIRAQVTTPTQWAEEGGMRLPFFCGDVTPRELRVRTRAP